MVRILLGLIQAYHNLEGKLYLWLKWFWERANLLFAKNPDKFVVLA